MTSREALASHDLPEDGSAINKILPGKPGRSMSQYPLKAV
jgi:hypothetical protein